jgi:hypothetical protein
MQTKQISSRVRPVSCTSHQQELERARKGSKLIRLAFEPLLKQVFDPKLPERLTAEALSVIKTDLINDFGKRTIEDGYLAILERFEFSKKKPFISVFGNTYKTHINREEGECLIHVSQLDAEWLLLQMSSATHVCITAAAALLDFEKETFVVDIKSSGCLHSVEPIGLTLQLQLPPASNLPLIIVLGISFYKVTNAFAVPVSRNGHMAATIIKTDQVQ